MVNLTSIRYAMLVAEHLSFSRAADILGIRQSAVSRRVRALEDILGVSLFERGSSGVRLTDAGRRFLDRAHSALAEIDLAVKVASNAGQGSDGTIRIGILSSLSAGFVRELLKQYREAHPAVTIFIAEGSASSHIALIRERRLDVAFVSGAAVAPQCDAEPFWDARVFVAISEAHPLAGMTEIGWNQLKAERFIVSRSGPGPEIHDYVIKRLADLGHTPQVEGFEVGRETLMQMVGIGFGISLISEAGIATRYPGVVFRPVANGQERVPYQAVWLAGNDNPALRRLLSLARVMRSALASLPEMVQKI